jgi:DNA-binding MarR family transcriptional regulator
MAQEDRFADLLSQIAREITLRQASDVCCGDLTLEQFQTLREIERSARPPSIGLLSAQLRVDLSTMSRNISVLERNGHLLRTRSGDDARVVHVKLTPKGKRGLETLRCGERDVLKDVYDRLPAAERAIVLRALEALRVCLGEQDAASVPCCAPATTRKTPS